jgi:hypothetical protein
MPTITNKYIYGGLYTANLINTTLPLSQAGDENNISLTDYLPSNIADLIVTGSVYAVLSSKNGKKEFVLIKQGSYDSGRKSFRIVRGQSKFVNGGYTEPVCYDRPTQLYLDFSIPHPETLQSLSNIQNNSLQTLTGAEFAKLEQIVASKEILDLLTQLSNPNKMAKLNTFLNS